MAARTIRTRYCNQDIPSVLSRVVVFIQAVRDEFQFTGKLVVHGFILVEFRDQLFSLPLVLLRLQIHTLADGKQYFLIDEIHPGNIIDQVGFSMFERIFMNISELRVRIQSRTDPGNNGGDIYMVLLFKKGQ
jgi:hypothetical protein